MTSSTKMSSFYSQSELLDLGFKSFGSDVKISRKASFYQTHMISFGDHVRIDDFCILSGGSGIELGSYVHIAAYSALFGNEGIVLEDFAGLSARVTVYSASDDYSGMSLTNPTIPSEFLTHTNKGPVLLGRHAIIGTNSTILPNVRIGEGAAVGAHTLVSKSLDPWGVYFGIPAKFLKTRKKDLLEMEKKLLYSGVGA